MTAQLDIFSVLDDPTFVPASPALVREAPRAFPGYVEAWWKSYVGPPMPEANITLLPSLNQNPHDHHYYKRAKFGLAAGVKVEDYPGGFGQRGLRVKGEKDLLSLYDAVQKGLAIELR